MKSTWRVCYVPVFEGEDRSEILGNQLFPLEDSHFFCVGVVAESITEAIEKAQEEIPGTDLSKYLAGISDDSEKWKERSYVVEDVIVVGAELASTIHLG